MYSIPATARTEPRMNMLRRGIARSYMDLFSVRIIVFRGGWLGYPFITRKYGSSFPADHAFRKCGNVTDRTTTS